MNNNKWWAGKIRDYNYCMTDNYERKLIMILNDRTYSRYSSCYHCEKQNKSHVIVFIYFSFLFCHYSFVFVIAR